MNSMLLQSTGMVCQNAQQLFNSHGDGSIDAFFGEAADMRSGNHPGILNKAPVGGWFHFVGIKSDSGDLATGKTGHGRIRVDEAPPRGIDQIDAILHLGDCRFIHERFPVCGGRAVETDDVGISEKFVRVNEPKSIPETQTNVDVGIVGEDFHAESECEPRYRLANGTAADEAKRASGDLDSFATLPTILFHGQIAERHGSDECQDEAEREFGNTPGVGPGSAADG